MGPRSSSKRKYVQEGATSGQLMEENLSGLSQRFRTMLATALSCGDNERVMQGLFENYLEVKFKDNALQNVNQGTEWFRFFDVTQNWINRSQNYSTMPYLPYTFVASHLLFASNAQTEVQYPSTHFEVKTKIQKSSQTIAAMVSEMAPLTRIFTPPTVLVLDALPLILEVISRPNIRAVNTQLYSAKEKEDLKALVAILLAFNLNFVQERGLDGQYSYRLDPPVESVAHFPELTHKSLPYAVKQLISHEVEVEKMRREESPNLEPSKPAKPAAKAQDKALPNHLNQKLKAKAVNIEKEIVPTDFFGRQIEARAKTADEVQNSLFVQ